MSTGAAADLARLRHAYGARWRIDREDGPIQERATRAAYAGPPSYVARHRSTGKVLRAGTAAELENTLRTVES
jgi:hypothetical protein